eukprot:9497348-Pyramimonas_sp.AAC.1
MLLCTPAGTADNFRRSSVRLGRPASHPDSTASRIVNAEADCTVHALASKSLQLRRDVVTEPHRGRHDS